MTSRSNGDHDDEKPRRFFGRFELVSARQDSIHLPAAGGHVAGVDLAKSKVPLDHSETLDDLETRLIDALRLQREEELAMLRFNRWQANVLKNQAHAHHDDHHTTPTAEPPVSALASVKAAAAATPLGTSVAHPRTVSLVDDWMLQELSWDDLKLVEKIGSGAFGDVFLARLWGQEVAVKKLLPRALFATASPAPDAPSPTLIIDFMREVNILRNLRHPNILSFMGMCYKKPDTLCIVTELASGSLADVLSKRAAAGKGPLATRKIVRYAKDIARALNYLHHKGVIHRDLKPSNLLLDRAGSIKISDFGLSHVKRKAAVETGSWGICGTPVYMAPEIIAAKPYGSKSDIFSFGIVVAEMLIGHYPYGDLNVSKQSFEKSIISGSRPSLPEHTPTLIRQLIESCWQEDPLTRPDCTRLLHLIAEIEETLPTPTTMPSARLLSLPRKHHHHHSKASFHLPAPVPAPLPQAPHPSIPRTSHENSSPSASIPPVITAEAHLNRARSMQPALPITPSHSLMHLLHRNDDDFDDDDLGEGWHEALSKLIEEDQHRIDSLTAALERSELALVQERQARIERQDLQLEKDRKVAEELAALREEVQREKAEAQRWRNSSTALQRQLDEVQKNSMFMRPVSYIAPLSSPHSRGRSHSAFSSPSLGATGVSATSDSPNLTALPGSIYHVLPTLDAPGSFRRRGLSATFTPRSTPVDGVVGPATSAPSPSTSTTAPPRFPPAAAFVSVATAAALNGPQWGARSSVTQALRRSVRARGRAGSGSVLAAMGMTEQQQEQYYQLQEHGDQVAVMAPSPDLPTPVFIPYAPQFDFRTASGIESTAQAAPLSVTSASSVDSNVASPQIAPITSSSWHSPQTLPSLAPASGSGFGMMEGGASFLMPIAEGALCPNNEQTVSGPASVQPGVQSGCANCMMRPHSLSGFAPQSYPPRRLHRRFYTVQSGVPLNAQHSLAVQGSTLIQSPSGRQFLASNHMPFAFSVPVLPAVDAIAPASQPELSPAEPSSAESSEAVIGSESVAKPIPFLGDLSHPSHPANTNASAVSAVSGSATGGKPIEVPLLFRSASLKS